ncbi:hypothetical protein ILYODFUR_032971, partial [Ilyodon furcidens]
TKLIVCFVTEIDEDRLPNQLYKAALLNSPRQRRKGQKGTPTMKGWREGWCISQAVIGREVGYTLDRSPVHT